jgi:pyruvate-formate lyase-activating enzyme
LWSDCSKDVEEIYRYTDLLLLDVKHIDNEWHRKLVGQGNEKVLENAKIREKKWPRNVVALCLGTGLDRSKRIFNCLG